MKRSGFTLIELLIVVAIIGILAMIAIPNFMNARIRAKVARVRSECRGLSEAYTMYYMDNGIWPPHIDGDPAQHRFVTTPIAYFNSSVYDPFQENVSDKLGYGKYVRVVENTRNQYHMEPVQPWIFSWFTGTQTRYPTFYSELRHCVYGAQSFGPDEDFDFNELYEPSNGTRSKGDMYTLVPGKN